jgi:hypothetical protein
MFQVCRARAQIYCREHPRMALVSCSRLSVRTNTHQHHKRPSSSRLQRQSDRAERYQGIFLDWLDQKKCPHSDRSTEANAANHSSSPRPTSKRARYLHLQGLRRQSLRSMRSPVARARNLFRVPGSHQRPARGGG